MSHLHLSPPGRPISTAWVRPLRLAFVRMNGGLLVALLLVACAAPAVVRPPGAADSVVSPPSLGSVPKSKPVFCLPPYLAFELTPGERPVTPRDEDRIAVERLVASTATRKLSESGFKVLTVADLSLEKRRSVDAILGILADRQQLLGRAYKDKSGLASELRELGEVTGASIACLQWLRVRIGRSGGWNLWSGAVWAGTHSSDVKVVLLSLYDGQHLWARQAYVHALPLDREFLTAMEALFAEPTAGSKTR
jgi:hypothetical protein